MRFINARRMEIVSGLAHRHSKKDPLTGALFTWLQGRDLNPRPPGYEPGELPDCSTLPRQPIASREGRRAEGTMSA
jgi:hypothetical protein